MTGVKETFWMRFKRCKDLDPRVFFPNDVIGVNHAKAICAECPVRTPCLDYAINNRIDYGVWGGTSERERKKIAARRRKKAA